MSIVIRLVLSVILGYATFAISAVLLFQLSGIDPHADPTMGVLLLTVTYGIVFSFMGGYLTQVISGTRTLTVNYVMAGLMVVFAAFSLLKTTGNHYSQITAIVLFAPSSILGGLTYLKKVRRKEK
jgi:hypothetical protein